MKKLNSLYNSIDKLLANNANSIIAIDGDAASGKTIFANFLAQKYKANLFHMDDFFLVQEKKTADRLNTPGGNIDWERFLKEVIIPIKNGQQVKYRRFSCKTNSISDETLIEKSNLSIVEGVYALNPNLSPYYDLKIFIHIDEATQKERILKRNGPKMLDLYRQEWLPLEEKYFTELEISSSCDFVFSFKDLL